MTELGETPRKNPFHNVDIFLVEPVYFGPETLGHRLHAQIRRKAKGLKEKPIIPVIAQSKPNKVQDGFFRIAGMGQRFKAADDKLADALRDPPVDILFAIEKVVNASHRHAGFAGQHFHRGLLVALLPEDKLGGIQESIIYGPVPSSDFPHTYVVRHRLPLSLALF
ncbi:MAG: hypothetical protein U9Q79_07600 [Candidatus Hydrogenedentes bacterium]|nr:hypothetical protein [Candidatus Hydrogenedentota bacterium]